ncbi:DoxX family protein [Amycolatopsis japonica]
MTIALWVVSGVLTAIYLAAGLPKCARPKHALITSPNFGGLTDVSPAAIKLIGIAEVLGAIGLVLPELTDVATTLTPMAAVGLAMLQVGAFLVHARRGERSMLPVNVTLFLLAVFVAVGRLMT